MYLLDLVAQGRAHQVTPSPDHALPGAARFQGVLQRCPLRYVLTDELARCATEMAFADGDRLTSCLDLIRVPAHSLWIEWADAARRLDTLAIASGGIHDTQGTHRAGVLLDAAADGRSGSLRSFWSTRDGDAFCSPLSAMFNFDGLPSVTTAADPRRSAQVTAPAQFGLDGFLGHLRFELDEAWAAYYAGACTSAAMRHDVMRRNLGACAFDPPMVFAFLLMLSARGALPKRIVSLERLNLSRQRTARLPLLEHVVVSAPLYVSQPVAPGELTGAERRGPRLHHVCGHIVRRGAAVFWRSPHLRGSARLGQVRTRTVELAFAQAQV